MKWNHKILFHIAYSICHMFHKVVAGKRCLVIPCTAVFLPLNCKLTFIHDEFEFWVCSKYDDSTTGAAWGLGWKYGEAGRGRRNRCENDPRETGMEPDWRWSAWPQANAEDCRKSVRVNETIGVLYVNFVLSTQKNTLNWRFFFAKNKIKSTKIILFPGVACLILALMVSLKLSYLTTRKLVSHSNLPPSSSYSPIWLLRKVASSFHLPCA